MEPERLSTQLPSVGIEKSPVIYNAGVEKGGNALKIESVVEKRLDFHEGQSSNTQNNNDVSITSSLPTPVLNTTKVVNKTTHDDNPIEANDDGLIEKEWVNKAKQIISNTRNDPYKQEKAVNELQTDYLKKRYGEDLGTIQ